MAFRDALKKYRESQGAKTTASDTPQSIQLPTSDSSGSGDSNLSFRDALKRYREKQTTDSLQGWIDASLNLIQDVQNSSSIWYDDNEYQSRFDRFTSLLGNADNWRKQYAGNEEVVSYINSVVDDLSKAKSCSFSNRQFFSQWDTKEAYDKAVRESGWYEKYQGKTSAELTDLLETLDDGEEKDWVNSYQYRKDREEKNALDTEAAQAEIDVLNAQMEELRAGIYTGQGSSYLTGGNTTEASPYGAKLSGQQTETEERIGQLLKTINEKQQYLTLAKRVQEQEALSGVADETSKYYDSDFEKITGYRSTQNADAEWGENGIGDAQYEWINNQNGFRNYYDNEMAALAQRSGGSYESPYAQKGYDKLDENEIAIYNYYYAKDGKEKAQQYLNSIQEDLNYRMADSAYSILEGNTGLEMIFGVEAGLDQFQSGFESAVRMVMGDDSYKPVSATQMVSGMVREDLADNGWKLPQWMGGSSLGQVAYDTITTSSNMMPSVLTSMAVGMINPAAGGWVGGAMMGASAAGSAYQEAVNLGWTKNQARVYGVMVGASEIAMEKILGGITALGGGDGVGSLVLKNTLGKVDNALGRTALQLGANMLDEGIEEGLQEVLEPWLESIITGKDFAVAGENVLYASLLGALSASMMEGPNIATEQYSHYTTGQELKNKGITGEQLSKIGKTFSSDTVAYKLAGRVNADTGAYTIGRLFHEIDATMTAQNKAEITANLEQKGVATADAKVLVDAVAAVVDGAELTRKQEAALNANDVLAAAIAEELIDKNSTYYQRNQGYHEALMSLAKEKMNADTSRTEQTLPGQESTSVSNTVDGKTQAASEGVQEFSAEGKTLDGDGNIISIKGIKSIENGRMILETEDGRTVDAVDVNFASEGEALIYETVARMDVNPSAANVLVNAYHPESGVSAAVYAHGIQEAYRYGQYSYPVQEAANGPFSSMLTEQQRNTAYRLGQLFGGKQVAKEQAIVRKNRAVAKNATTAEKTSAVGKVHFDQKGRVFNEMQEAALTTMGQLSAALDVEFYVYESYVNEAGERVYKDADGNETPAPNGWYDPNSGAIHIDLNAGQNGKGTMLFTVAHELTHFIKQWSPAKFKVLSNFLVKQYGEKGVSVTELVQRQMDKAKRSGRSLSWEEAHEEMVADSMETMLTDGNVVQVMADLKQQDKGLWEKIKDWFRDLAEKLQRMVDAYKGVQPDTVEGRMVADMQDVIGVLQSLYEDALADAGENFQSAEKNTTGSGVSGETAIKRSERIVDQIRKSLHDIMSLDSVYEIDASNAVPYTSDRKTDEKSGNDVFKAQGGAAYRAGFGRVVLSKRSVIQTVHHGNGPAKQAAFPAIKAVIEQGIEIYRDNNHNDKGYDTITFSAPITFFGKDAPLAVVVKSFESANADKTFYIHEICDAEGNYIQMEEETSNKKTSSTNFVEPTSTVSAADGIPPKTSIRNKGEKVNKKLSDRDPAAGRVNEVLQKENTQLKEDVQYLKDLLKIQKTVTNGTKFTKTSVEAMASMLMKGNNAKGDKKELAKLLNEVYEYIARGEELTWEGVAEMAQPAVDWLRSHTVIKSELSQYAQDILHDVRTSRVSLDESQQAEAAYRYGSFNDFRKAMMGSIVIAKDGIPLDIQWQEWASTYPDVFDVNMSASDMPGALADILSSLRNSDLSRAEYAYHADMIAQDLLQQVYDGYWQVSTLRTVADVKQRQINELRGKHYQKMNDLRQFHLEKTDQLKREHRADMKRIRQEYRETSEKKQREIIERYQESRKKATESRNRTAMRHKIQRVVDELNRYLLHGTKERHVPEGLQKAVAGILDSLNMEVRNEEQRKASFEATLARYDRQIAMESDPEKVRELIEKRKAYEEKGDQFKAKMEALKLAYDEVQNSEDPLLSNAYDDGLSAHMMTLIVEVGDTPLGEMSLRQLECVYDVCRIVQTTIRNANKAFKAAKNASIAELGSRVMQEVAGKTKDRKYDLSAMEAIRKFGWNNLKPVYAFETIGSNTFTEIFNNVRKGEDVWARDVTEARKFYLEKSKKYGYNSWDFDKRFTFTSTSDMDFSLSLEQIMSLYAYSKREQAADHLRKGGIVFDESTEVTMKTKLGFQAKFNPTEATAYNISSETLAEIVGKLTKEQKGYVDEMQEYLSTVMGNKGNEVSMEMYGIKLFKEKFYFPLKSASQFMAKAKEQQQGEVKIKNSGFSKETVKKASNPIVLTPFMNVWADHVNEMSMYHAFVLPMEDFYRVYNYRTATSDTAATESVEMYLQNAFGKGATKYIDQLLKDLNGGARTDSTTGVINKMMGMFKKGAVFASASVVVQQPSAIARATAIVDTKYFIGQKVDHKRHKALWEEVKKYAPVAIIKEMGYFDTNIGKSTQDFILGKEYSGIGEKMKALVTDSNYRDEILSKAPALADEIAWCSIWDAVKRETLAKYPGADTKSEIFLKKAGERFTEVIVRTQVYDSVLSRSANMRSKDTGMKMATAFMAEPTTSINMIANALIKGKQGTAEGRKYCRRTIGAVIASQILNAFLVSFVYAARDDDEEKTYLEKYVGSFTAEMLDGMNPLTYIPFIKDMVSIAQGYTVERSDMAVISDLWNAWKQLKSDKLSTWRKVEGFIGSICQIFGLPVKNIMRDMRGVWQAFDTIVNGEKVTLRGTGYAVKEAVTGNSVPGYEQLYEARLAGDEAHEVRVEAHYEDEDSANAAVRLAIKNHFMEGQIDTQTALRQMVLYTGMDGSEAHWLMDAWEYRKAMGTDEGYSMYNRFFEAVQTGENLKATIKEYTDNGVKDTTLVSMITKHFKTEYLEMSSSERAGTRDYLINAYEQCGLTREEAEERLSDWDFEAKYGFDYSNRRTAYLEGTVSAAQLKSILVAEGGYTAEDAAYQIKAYDWDAQGYENVTLAAIRAYEQYCEVASVPKSIFLHIRDFSNSTENDVDEEGKTIYYSAMKKVMAEIDAQNLTAEQKTAIANSLGWSEKNINKYKPW